MFFHGENIARSTRRDWVGMINRPVHRPRHDRRLLRHSFLLLGATSFYPVVRFRALFAVGMLCFMFFLTGEYQLMIAVGAGKIGMYFMKLSVVVGTADPFGAPWLGGMATLAYFRVLRRGRAQ
jgi:hypothetical protein